MKNVWKLSNYHFDWQWKKWNQKVTLVSGLLAVFCLIAMAFPTGNPQSYEYYSKYFQSYDMAVDGSLLPVIFGLGLILILVGLFIQIKGFSTNAKGIYTLFLLPMKRSEVYLSFLLSAGAAVAVYYLMWLVLLVAAYFAIMAVYESEAAQEIFILAKDNIVTGLDVSQTNGLFLAFQRSAFLRAFFPASLWNVMPVIGGLLLIVTGIFFAGFYTQEVGIRIICSFGAILGGGYIYLQDFIRGVRLAMGHGVTNHAIGYQMILGLIGLIVAVVLQLYIIRRLDDRTDL
ncbi:MAG: hypothetical protein IJY52_00950 [Anaerotignum sp.]|nr:hypothetical protein [Anaerotignum sp.]